MMPIRAGSAIFRATRWSTVALMSRTPLTRRAPLSRLTKRLPKPEEPRTLGAAGTETQAPAGGRLDRAGEDECARAAVAREGEAGEPRGGEGGAGGRAAARPARQIDQGELPPAAGVPVEGGDAAVLGDLEA